MPSPGDPGWFAIPGVQEGPRTLSEQLLGLELIASNVQGKTVLDLGCAEAMIAAHMLKSGAKRADAVDGNIACINTATRVHKTLAQDRKLRLHCANLTGAGERNKVPLLATYDVVLLLSIIHKLDDPPGFMRWATRKADDWLAIRLPRKGANVIKGTSREFNVEPMLAGDFSCVAEPKGPRGEWVGIYRRKC